MFIMLKLCLLLTVIKFCDNLEPVSKNNISTSDKYKCSQEVFGCHIRPPDKGKWIDNETKAEIGAGSCVKFNTHILAVCDENYNHFGLKNFTAECLYGEFTKTSYSCTDKSAEGYVQNSDCIVPHNRVNSKWILTESNQDISEGAYVKQGVKIRSLCFRNFTRYREGTAECVEGGWTDLPERCGDIYPVEVTENRKNDYCLVPAQPDNGRWVTWDSKTSLTPGRYVNRLTKMSVVCKKNHKDFSTITFAECGSGEWKNINSFGFCEAVCESLNSTEQYKVTCQSKNKRSENCTEPLEGAIAEVTCQPIYQNLHIWESRSKFRICLRGSWDNNVFPNCIPKTKCGVKPPNLQPLVVSGAEASKGGYPWHVAIYQKKLAEKNNICGGSLISDRIVITAAHCITDPYGRVRNESMYEVAVGKHFRNFNDSRDEYSQSSTVIKLFVPDTYKGSLKNFVGDIGIMITKEVFKLHDSILPICVNFGTDKLEEKLLAAKNNLGYVPGFGYTETGNVSETLKEVAVPFIKHEKCSKSLPEEFIEFYSYDKFCAGHLNKSTAVCQGDSGGGLVVHNPLDNRFYLAGIVSVTPLDTTGGPLACDIQQYALYTKVADYIDFIRDVGGEYLQANIKTERVSENPAVKECQKYIEKYPAIASSENKKVFPHNFPFLAIIGAQEENKIRWFCSGNLVSDNFIVTAASCVVSPQKNKSLTVRLGIDNYNTPLSDAEIESKEYHAQEIFISPDYNPPQIYNDIALIKLDRRVEFTDSVHAVCLDTEKDSLPTGQTVRSSTWTPIKQDIMSSSKEGRLSASFLEIHNAEECERYFTRLSSDALLDGVVDDVQLCVRPTVYHNVLVDEPTDVCELFPGDSLAIIKKDAESGKTYYRLAGVASSVKDCKKVRNFVIFTKVSAFVPWIENVVWPSSRR